MSHDPLLDPAFRLARRDRIRRHADQVGLDDLQVVRRDEAQWELQLRLVPDDSPGKNRQFIEQLSSSNFRLLDARGRHVEEVSLQLNTPPANAAWDLTVTLQHAADALPRLVADGLYRLCLVEGDDVDPLFRELSFAFAGAAPQSAAPAPAPSTVAPAPHPDYDTRDYAGYRQLMFDRMAALVPDWPQRHPEDLTTVLVEVLANAADQLTYYQEAVAGEAYLSTARQRSSLRRHAIITGNTLGEGCNARAWVCIEVVADSATLPAGTRLMSGMPNRAAGISPGEAEAALGSALVFETMHDVTLSANHNEIEFYDWGAQELQLPAGTVQATFQGPLEQLAEGDVLVLEEARGPRSGRREDRDPEHAQAVRIVEIQRVKDPFADEHVALWQVTWHAEDALRRPLFITAREGLQTIRRISIARGNVVLVDHGMTIEEEIRVEPPGRGTRAPSVRLGRPDLTHRMPYNHGEAQQLPAAAAGVQDRGRIAPQVTLHRHGETWEPRSCLLHHDARMRGFVVEIDNQRQTILRFGDAHHGRRPPDGELFRAVYRVGNGPAGKVGRDSIRHVVTNHAITRVNNPLPAEGGAPQQEAEELRATVRRSLRRRTSCATPEEFVRLAEMDSEVRKAAATIRWTGAWSTVSLFVDRRHGKPNNAAFRERLRRQLEPFRIAGVELKVLPPVYVPLQIELTVSYGAFDRMATRQKLLEVLGSGRQADGRRGYFHPDRVTFGQTVFASKLIALAMEVPGVERANLRRLQRFTPPDRKARKSGARLILGPSEIPRMDNDPSAPRRGLLVITETT